MDLNCKHSEGSSGIKGTMQNETNAEMSGDSVVRLNSKDELNWVENEIVVVDSLNDRVITESVHAEKIVDSNNKNKVIGICKQSETSNDTNVDYEMTGDVSLQEHKGDESETKLWEYFTEHNSSQLRCNLCLGLFLFQSNASHLLKHVEVAHGISVLPKNENQIVNLDTNMNSSTSQENIYPNERNANILTEMSDCLESDLIGSVELKNIFNEVLRYFTTLESGKIRCNLCCRVLSCRSNKNSVLRHLVSNHNNTYRYIVESMNESVVSDNEIHINSVKSLPSELSEYFTMVDGDRVQCNFCNNRLKFCEGANKNLIRHLKRRHDVEDRSKNNNTNCEKKKSTSIILEIIQEGDMCLITNAQMCTGNQSVFNEGSKCSITKEVEEEDKITVNSGKVNKSKLRKIWSYFTKLRVNNKVRCNICSKVLFYKISLLKLCRHLAIKHKIHITKHSKQRKFHFENHMKQDSGDEDRDFEYRLNQKLTVDDISDINLFSIINTDQIELKSVKRKIKHKRLLSSWLWKHYTKLYRDKAMCNICDKTLTYKLGQTSILIKHLQIQHRFVYNRNITRTSVENRNNAFGNRRFNNTDIWNFFTKLDDNLAECDLCEQMNVFYYSSRSRSNLTKHLRLKHKYFLESKYRHKERIIRKDTVQIKDKASNDNSASGIDMKTLFDYYSNDANIQDYIKFENDQIICKLCTGTFLCDNLLNFKGTIKSHLQICHVGSVSPSRFMSAVGESDLEVESNTSYDELDAISNEIHSYGE